MMVDLDRFACILGRQDLVDILFIRLSRLVGILVT